MIKALSEFFDQAFAGNVAPTDSDREHTLKLATALLLVEVARADYHEDVAEDRVIVELLKQHLDLNDAEIDLLIAEAKEQADHSASLQAFTRQLHGELSLDEKHLIIEMLWRVALADQRLDKHEDHLVRKIAGLLYISHGDLIRIRNSINDGAQ